MLNQVSDELVPIRRPHFGLREGRLYFMLSTRPCAELDVADETLWSGIDGEVTVGQLREDFPDVSTRLLRFWDLGLCELAQSRFAENRRRVLVFEPHMDDAALSVGGVMWKLRNECEFILVSIAGYSNFTSNYFLDREYFDLDQITALREAESALVMRLMGGRHLMLGEYDAPVRFQPGNWTLDWYRSNRRCVNAFIDHCSPESEIASWASAIERVLEEEHDAQEIWMPLGVGGHTDHELARNACLKALDRRSGAESRASLFFYQDVPYAIQFPEHTAQILHAITSAGGELVYQPEDISESLAGKLRLNSIYGSQFKLSYIAPKIEEAARRASIAADGCCEILFKVKKLPGPVAPLAVYSGRAAVESLATRLGRWYRLHRQTTRIRVVSLVGMGRWADDFQFLLDAFPLARFEVHLSETCVGETARLVSPRITVKAVSGRGRAWLGLLLRLGLSRPCPLIVMTGDARRNLNPLFKAAGVLSDPLFATTTNHLIQALRAIDAR